jgi:hypothetical protein
MKRAGIPSRSSAAADERGLAAPERTGHRTAGEAPDPANCMNSSWNDILPRRDLLRELTPSEA